MLRYDFVRADDGVRVVHSGDQVLEAAGSEHTRRVSGAGGGSSFGGSSKFNRPKRHGPAHAKASPEIVLRSFNTWAFKREQPSDQHLLLTSVSRAMGRHEPISFVLYWGKGPRSTLEKPDLECLDYLDSMARRVRAAYEPGAAFKLIFTDTHASLNGHTSDSMRDYFGAIEAAAGKHGFDTCSLDQLVRAAHALGSKDRHDDPSEDTLRRLAVSAAKWYRGEGTPEEGAAKYYRMNMLEKRAVERAFPHAIFLTFNGSELRDLFPDRMPIFYSYSLRRGVSVKPWFLLPAAAAKAVEASDPS